VEENADRIGLTVLGVAGAAIAAHAVVSAARNASLKRQDLKPLGPPASSGQPEQHKEQQAESAVHEENR
jgi:hydrogenase small subunit